MAANDIILFRKGSYSQWVSANPVLASGEPGHDLTNNVLKIGDGTSNWNTLVSIGGGGGSGSTDVFEYVTTSNFPATGAAAVIYIATDTGRTYRWNSPYYVEIGSVGGGDSRFDLFKPAVPTGVTAAGGNAQAVVSWTAPSVLSQTPITDYIVQFSTNSGSTYTTFADGTSTAATATVTGLTNGTAHVFRVAAINALGTGAFSAASAAVTPTAGDALFASVALLLPMDGEGNTFVDSSPTPKTITAVGNATQSATESKWGGKSLALDGSNSNLSLPSSEFVFSGDFVIEGWIYLSSNPVYSTIIDTRSSPSFADFAAGVYSISGGHRLDFVLGGGVRLTASSTSVTLGSWSHFAFVRSGGVISGYVNGVRDATQLSYATSISPTSATALIGRNVDGNFINGYIDDLRVTVGSDRGYTGATITVPAAAFPTRGIYEDPFMERVSLLLPFDGTGATFIDSSLTPKTVTAFGDATQSAAQSKWGGKSLSLDGSGDYLSVTDSANGLAFGTGDFAYEFWFKSTDSNPYSALITRPYSSAGGLFVGLNGASGNGRPEIYWREFENALFIQSDTAGFNDGNWHHFAFARSGTTCSMYINGIVRGSRTEVGTSVSSSTLIIGSDIEYGGRDLNGYIDDVRITKGSRYSGNTIPVPTAAFPTS